MGLEGRNSRECKLVLAEGGYRSFDKSEAFENLFVFPLGVVIVGLWVFTSCGLCKEIERL